MSRATLIERAPTRELREASVKVGVLSLDGAWPVHHGGEIDRCDIAYELCGADGAPVVAALGGISASRHVTSHAQDRGAGWWEAVAGAGRAVDTTRLRVLGIDYLGGAGASTGPHTRGDFPCIDTRDQARALAAVLDHLSIPRLHALVGASYGGMVALAFASLHAGRAERVVAIGAAHRPHPMASALRAIQRGIVQLGVETGEPGRAVQLARALGVTTYRSAAEFARRFHYRGVLHQRGVRLPVQDYLEHCGERFAGMFPPECFLRLSESIDLHDITPESISGSVTLVAIEGDSVTPPWQVRELAAGLAGRAALVEVPSIYGHDAFLKEVGLMSGIVRQALAGPGEGNGGA